MRWLDPFFGGSEQDQQAKPKPLPKAASQNYDNIRRQCLESGQLWEDPIFSPKGRSRSDCIWQRPFEFTNNPQFIAAGVSRFDVVQGELGDCWLIAAIANLTLNQKLFSLVVPPDQSFERGSYCGIFRFKFWHFGQWIEVCVDDRLPTRGGKLLFLHSSDPNEFWSSLFEKAYAKLHGSYDALRGGTTCEAMVDLTGGLTEFFDVQTAESPPNLFAIIKKAYERGSLIGCSIEALDESQRENELSNGLIKGHAYSITAVLDLNAGGRNIPMLRLRNPWSGTSEWNGPWCDKSREWSMISDYEKQRIGLVFEADGEFWISFHDFKQNFTRVELCNLTPDALESETSRHQWHAQMFEGSWIRGQTAGGCRNNLQTFALNPQYLITLVDPDEEDNEENCTMIVALMQKSQRSASKVLMGSSELTIGFAIYALKDGLYQRDPIGESSPKFRQQLLTTEFFKYNCSVARSPTYINLREVTARFSLPPGTYAIIPSTFDKGEEGDFILRVWTESPAQGGPASSADAVLPPLGPPVQPSPRPSPKPSPKPAPMQPDQPSYPSYPRFPTPTPADGDRDGRQPSPSYPPYPSGPGYPSYPPSVPTGPSYPTLPGTGGDFNYPVMPEEPSIIRRKVVPPPPGPGPSIDISITEVIGTISTIISILTMCWSAYQRMTATSQTYPQSYSQPPYPSQPAYPQSYTANLPRADPSRPIDQIESFFNQISSYSVRSGNNTTTTTTTTTNQDGSQTKTIRTITRRTETSL